MANDEGKSLNSLPAPRMRSRKLDRRDENPVDPKEDFRPFAIVSQKKFDDCHTDKADNWPGDLPSPSSLSSLRWPSSPRLNLDINQEISHDGEEELKTKTSNGRFIAWHDAGPSRIPKTGGMNLQACVRKLKKAIFDGGDDEDNGKSFSILPVESDIDIWCMGVPQLLTYQVLADLFRELDSTYIALLTDVQGSPELTGWITQMLQCMAEHEEGSEMRESLMRLQNDPLILGRQTEMLRAGLQHPTREEIMCHEPDTHAKGKLRACTVKGESDNFVFLIDRFLCLKKLQNAPGWGSPLSLARTWDTGLPGADARNSLCTKLNNELEAIVMEALFTEIDFDGDQIVSVDEVREVLRIVLSRPLLGSILLDLVEADVLMAWKWPALLLKRGITVRRVAVNLIPETIRDFARDSPRIAGDWCGGLHQLATSELGHVIDKPEFLDLFLLCFEGSILHPLRKMLLPKMRSNCHLQTVQALKSTFESKSIDPAEMTMPMNTQDSCNYNWIFSNQAFSCAENGRGRDGPCLLSNLFQGVASFEKANKSAQEAADDLRTTLSDDLPTTSYKSRCRPGHCLSESL